MEKRKYIGCFYCDNIVDEPNQVGLLHLGFPRCFVLIPNLKDFYLSGFDNFIKKSKINWLDPSDEGTPEEQQRVLEMLYNFSVEQEEKEDRLYEERSGENW